MPPKKVESFLQCIKCKEIFNETNRKPKLLVCHHTCCLQCLERMVKKTQGGSVVQCPVCSKTTSICKKGVNSLQTNMYIQPLLKQVSTVVEDEVFQSDSEDAEENDDDWKTIGKHGKPPSNVGAKIWCKTCMKTADSKCTATHDICNYEQGKKFLEMQLDSLEKEANNILTEEESLLQTKLEFFSSAQQAWCSGISSSLEEKINKHTLTISTVRSQIDELKLLKKPSKKPEMIIENIKKINKHLEDSRNRMQDDHTSLLQIIKNAYVTVHFPNPTDILKNDKSGKKVDTCSFLYKLGEKNIAEDKGLAYILYCLIESKSKRDSQKLSSYSAATDVSWQKVETKRKSKNVVTNFKPQYSVKSVGNSRPNTPLLKGSSSNLSVTPAGSREVLNQSTHNFSYILPSNQPNSVECFFDITINNFPVGRIVITLRFDVAPKMCYNFLKLCLGNSGIGYRGSKIFKTHPNDHIVGGDFENNDGTGGYSVYEEERLFLGDNSGLPDEVGAVRMRGMGTDEETKLGRIGSQFHIWVGERDFKSYRRTLVIGKVKEGLDICKKISLHKASRDVAGKFSLVDDIRISDCGLA